MGRNVPNTVYQQQSRHSEHCNMAAAVKYLILMRSNFYKEELKTGHIEVKMEQLFLFGTGKVAEKYTKYLNQLLIKIDGYIDNNEAKWGQLFHDRPVYKCDVLKEINNAKVLIACADIKGVTEQLTRLNVQDKIVSLQSLIADSKALEMESEKIYLKFSDRLNARTQLVVIDNLEGTWGGAEDWAHKIALSLLERNYDVIVVENANQTYIDERLRKNTLFCKKDAPDMQLKLMEDLVQRSPLILINIWNSNLLWAASYIKKFSANVKVISVLLNDVESLYLTQQIWDHSIDRYLCISSRIKNKLIDVYGIKEQKVYYRIPFIEREEITEREYNAVSDRALVIVYPCRLVKGQKRADLLPEFIAELEKRKINYVFNIVGDGACEEEIRMYIQHNRLNDKVFLSGRLSRKELISFLNKQDIYLNFSEYEGMSLTMLEAMARGCVPVVTNVSGVSDVIVNKENGFISETGDLKGMADNILFLDRNRTLLESWGTKCKDIVLKNCNIDDYMDHIENVLKIKVM